MSGVWQVLRRLKIHYKRGRRVVHSPDPDYDAKLTIIRTFIEQARAQPKRIVVVYHDELTYYRKPSVGRSYALAGSKGPLARQGWGYNYTRRIAASLNVVTGRLFSWQRAKFDRFTLIRYFKALEAAYPDAERIWVILDNWPVHFHPDVLAALRDSKVKLMPLPTYAPWTNPTEKVWLKLHADVLHLHTLADDWDQLQRVVDTWLNRYANESTDLLRFVGLCID